MRQTIRVLIGVAALVAAGCVPQPPQTTPLTATTISAGGGDHTCALKPDQTVTCWGDNTWGQLGNGQTGDSAVPVKVIGVTSAVSVAAGTDHSCAVLSDGRLACWGRNQDGQLGADADLAPHPTAVITGPWTDNISTMFGLLPWKATRATAGDDTTCIAGSFPSPQPIGGQTPAVARCFGRFDGTPQSVVFGRWTLTNQGMITTTDLQALGVGNGGACLVYRGPTWYIHECIGTPAPATSWKFPVAMGEGSACFFDLCSGANEFGQLGDGTTTSPGPVTSRYQAVVVGKHSCSLDTVVRCWGLNDHGQLGNGTTTNSFDAVEVPATTGAVQVVRGDRHTCTRMNNNTVQCWGRNNHGQLGNGFTLDSYGPVVVAAS